MSELDKQREVFEAWITRPPFEHDCARKGAFSALPGSYERVDTELAWEAWKERHYQSVDHKHLIAENERLREQRNRARLAEQIKYEPIIARLKKALRLIMQESEGHDILVYEIARDALKDKDDNE